MRKPQVASQLELGAPKSGVREASSRLSMPTILGVGEELWLEPCPAPSRALEASGLERAELIGRPQTLREDQPELAETYRRAASKIMLTDAQIWATQGAQISPARLSRMSRAIAAPVTLASASVVHSSFERGAPGDEEPIVELYDGDFHLVDE